MLSKESGDEAARLGLLSKESLDELYLQTQQETMEDADAEKEGLARSIAEQIARNPDVADVAQRVEAYAKPAAMPPPSQAPAPTAPPVVSTPAPLPVSTPPAQAPMLMPRGDGYVPPAVPTSVPTQAAPVAKEEIQTAVPSDSAVVNTANNIASSGGSSVDVLGTFEQGMRMKEAGILAAANATQASMAQSGAIYAEEAQKARDQANAYAAQRAAIQARIEEQVAKYQAEADAYAKAEIDPNHFWGSRTTEQKIAATVGLLFSGFGGGNQAGKVIDEAIKNDIQLQKDNLDLKRQGLDVRNNLLGRMFEVTGDIDDAMTMTRAIQKEEVAYRLANAAARVGGGEAKANMMKELGTLRMDAAKDMADVMQKAGIRVEQQFAAAGQAPGAGAGGSSSVPVLPENFNPAQLDEKTRKFYIPGLGIAPNQDAYKKATDGNAAFDQASRIIGELRDLRKDVGVESLNTQSRAKAISLRTQLLAVTKRMEQLGALDNGVDVFFSGLIPQDPLGGQGFDVMGIGTKLGNMPLGDRLITQLDEYEKNMKSQYANNLKNHLIYRSPETDRYLRLGDAMNSAGLPKLPGSK